MAWKGMPGQEGEGVGYYFVINSFLSTISVSIFETHCIRHHANPVANLRTWTYSNEEIMQSGSLWAHGPTNVMGGNREESNGCQEKSRNFINYFHTKEHVFLCEHWWHFFFKTPNHISRGLQGALLAETCCHQWQSPIHVFVGVANPQMVVATCRKQVLLAE